MLFSVFEFGEVNIKKGIFPNDVLNWLFEFAYEIDQLNYNRLWISEHYSQDFAWFNPQVLLPLLVSQTNNIRIGQAGVLASYHSPITIAQNFKLLNYYFEDRVDLGFAYSNLPNDISKDLYNVDDTCLEKHWVNQVKSTIELLEDNSINNSNIILPPFNIKTPDIWFFGKSSYNTALEMRGNLCVSLYHNHNINDSDIFRRYRRDFFNYYKTYPKTALAVKIYCDDNEKKINNYLKLQKEENNFRKRDIPVIIGQTEVCMEKILDLYNKFKFDEIIIINNGIALDDKIRSIHNIKIINKNINELYCFK